MQLEIILISLSLIVLLVASIFDIKTREIPDLLSYSFIASVLGIRLIYSLFTDFSFLCVRIFVTVARLFCNLSNNR